MTVEVPNPGANSLKVALIKLANSWEGDSL